MHYKSIIGLVIAAAFAVPASGCIVTTDDTHSAPSVSSGTLSVDTTITGTTDPGLCDYYAVADIELVVYSRDGGVVTTSYSPCESFRVSVDLLPGTYEADVTLVDSARNAASTTLPLHDLRVATDAELVVDVDFPPDSIL